MECGLGNSYTTGLRKKKTQTSKTFHSQEIFEEKLPEPFREMMLGILQLGWSHIHLLSVWNSLISERIFGKGWM